MGRARDLVALLVFVFSATATVGGETADREWTALFNGRDLSGWKLRVPNGPNGWRVEDGLLINKTPSTDILTEKWFRDFDLHVEFKIPRGSNSGLYLLGRYEVQIQDDYGRPVRSSTCGSLYRQIAPSTNACKKAGEWQTFDISFRAARFSPDGRKLENARVTVVFNGVKVIDDAELTGPTGSRRRFDEEALGPILIQGDHGDIVFRDIRIRGKSYDPPSPDDPGPEIIAPEIEPIEMPLNKAKGLALKWRTVNHAYAPAFRVYRGLSPDFPLDAQHMVLTAVRRSCRDCSFETSANRYYRIVALGIGGKPGRPSEVVSGFGPANQVATPYLGDASWARILGDRTPKRNAAYSRKRMSMHGKRFSRGIGMCGNSTILFNIGQMVGNRSGYRFRATIGLDDSIRSDRRGRAASRFIVRLDGKKVFDSGPLKWADGTREVNIAIPAGTKHLELAVVTEGRRGWDYANWAEARIVAGGG